jgi:hypothetical protein
MFVYRVPQKDSNVRHAFISRFVGAKSIIQAPIKYCIPCTLSHHYNSMAFLGYTRFNPLQETVLPIKLKIEFRNLNFGWRWKPNKFLPIEC